MRNEDWQRLDDDRLERILIERWLYRGLMLGVIFLSALAVTWLASQGLAEAREQVTAGVLIALALAAAAVIFVMRQQDLRIHRELRQRRRRGGA
jgi:hypothetical protein